MQPVRYFHIWRLAFVIGLVLLTGVALVWAFAEEPLYFRYPDGTPGSQEISTLHDDLTYALALAAGFSITDSRTLRIWDQLTDSEIITATGEPTYTNAGGAFYSAPDPDLVCQGKFLSPVPIHTIWPLSRSMVVSNGMTSRYGPYSPFFHFPHLTGPYQARDIGMLHDWGWGITNTLTAYGAYAWGKLSEVTVMQASCTYTRPEVISTSIQAGSLEAFATYLHSLGDSYSHLACVQAMDAISMPWATHTITTAGGVPECYYPPSDPSNTDAHGVEFGTGSMTDSLRTDAAIRAIYGELAARSLQREGQYWPINLDTPISGTQTLSDTLYAFVHNWNYDQAPARRAYADSLVLVLAAQPRAPIQRVYLPIVLR
jgi:hypothetical protein